MRDLSCENGFHLHDNEQVGGTHFFTKPRFDIEAKGRLHWLLIVVRSRPQVTHEEFYTVTLTVHMH